MLKTGLHDVVMGYLVITMTIMRSFEARIHISRCSGITKFDVQEIANSIINTTSAKKAPQDMSLSSPDVFLTYTVLL